MKTKIIFFILPIFFPFFVFSQVVSEKEALTVAKNFFYEKINRTKSVSYNEISLNLNDTYTQNGKVIFRVFEPNSGKGFILVTADYKLHPVIGYSFESNYTGIDNELPSNFKEWIEAYVKQIEEVSSQKELLENELWTYYSKKPELNKSKDTKDAAALLPTTWNQGCGYNSLCPEDVSGPCHYVWAGCVATAMAEVMMYHQHPVSGEGSHSYTHYTYGEQFADFESAFYDYSNMTLYSGNDEVAELIYHCGVSVNMNYSPSGSGAFSSNVVRAWKDYFKYSPNMVLTSKSSYTDENWAKLLIAEIDAGRPLYYHGYGSGGHAFNIDGYQGSDYFHLNWGWGGSYNGYFYLDDLTPGGHNFTNSQGTIVGAIDRDLYPGINCSSPIILTSNTPYYGSTTTSENIVNKYGNCYYHNTGKEVVHQINTSYPGRIRATLSDLNGNNLDVFILSHCNQDSLLAYGDSTCFADNTEPGTYYIVVDGRYAYEGDYTLTVTCPTNEPDLIISEQLINPMYVEAGGPANISLKISNIGNSTAIANKLNVYYSEDNLFDGSDIFIEQYDIISLAVGEHMLLSEYITIPLSAAEGLKYIIFVADAENDVVESDELYNTAFGSFNVPPAGIMDCSSSVSLNSGIWYKGNTEKEGNSDIDNYLYGVYEGNEVIHQITPSYNGTAIIEFSEKIPGNLTLLPLSACNENTCLANLSIWNPEDTIIHESLKVIAGVTYYFVVDAEEGTAGDYYLKVTMPGECPEPYISAYGETDLCDTLSGTNLFTDWTYDICQWYKDGILIPEETRPYLWATESGIYKVEVTENECSAFSDEIQVRFSPAPDDATVIPGGDTIFCEGGNVNLNLNTGSGNTVQWMKNGKIIDGETGTLLKADQSGIYSAKITNISCTVQSNETEVIVKPVTADLGEFSRVNPTGLISYFSCDIYDNYDLSGNGNDYFFSGWTFPEDRFGEWNTCHFYNGKWEYTYTDKSFNDPDTFTIAFWFKTSTAEGGNLISFGNEQTGLSTQNDRMIWMSDDGKLHFGILNGSANVISSVDSYNDNNWHFVAASLSPSGMKLYIDGVLEIENNTVTDAGDFIGWWKLAYDYIDASYSNIPTSFYYKGHIDDVRIYYRELLIGEIGFLYNYGTLFIAENSNSDHCEAGSGQITLKNSEADIIYQMRNDSDNSPVGFAVEGNAGDIIFNTEELDMTTSFNFLATNPYNGCSIELRDIFTIEIHEPPEVDLGPDFSIQIDQTELLNPGSGFVNYYWNNGSNGQTLFIDGSVLGIGEYEFWVEVEDANSCENSDTVMVTVTESSDIRPLSKEYISVYPNPTSGKLFIDLSEKKVEKIQVTDLFGKVISEMQPNDKKYILDLTDRPNGIYIIRFDTDGKTFINKVVLQR